jgi:hypothetical protein
MDPSATEILSPQSTNLYRDSALIIAQHKSLKADLRD